MCSLNECRGLIYISVQDMFNSIEQFLDGQAGLHAIDDVDSDPGINRPICTDAGACIEKKALQRH